MKIYTRGGDGGDTSLFDQTRVSKADARVEAYGDVDELNACIGAARAGASDPDITAPLEQIQRDLFALGAMLADPAARIARRVDKASVDAVAVRRLEETIDAFDANLPLLRHFILPGGSPRGAQLHLARTVCRRAERRVVSLGDAVDPIVIAYLNRLSDLLFVMARAVNHRDGVAEVEW